MADKKKRKRIVKPKTDKIEQSMDGLGVDFNTLMQTLVQPTDKTKDK